MSMGKVAKTRTLQQNAKKEEILVPALTALMGGWRTGGQDKAAVSGFRRVQPTGDIPSAAACLFPGATAASPHWRREGILMPSWGIRQERQSHCRHLGALLVTPGCILMVPLVLR